MANKLLDFIFTTPQQKESRRTVAATRDAVIDARPGLLADPSDPRRQVAFATAIQEANPTVGSNLLNQVLADQAAGRRSAQQQAGATERQSLGDVAAGERVDVQQAGAGERAAAANEQSGANAMLAAGVQIRGQDLSADAAATRNQAAAGAAARAAAREPAFGFNPYTSSATLIPVQGSEQWNKQDSQRTIIENMLVDVNAMMEDLSTFGTESYNKEVAGRMANRYANILLQAPKFRGAGAPQAAELEITAAGLGEPTAGILDRFTPSLPGQRDRLVAGYRDFAQQLSRSLIGVATQNPALPFKYALLDPMVFPPEVQAYIEANSPNLGNQLINPSGLPPVVQDFMRGTLPVQIEQP